MVKQLDSKQIQIQQELGISANELFSMDVIGATTELKNQVLGIMEFSDCKQNNSVFNFFSW